LKAELTTSRSTAGGREWQRFLNWVCIIDTVSVWSTKASRYWTTLLQITHGSDPTKVTTVVKQTQYITMLRRFESTWRLLKAKG